jgi:hypothetical protein
MRYGLLADALRDPARRPRGRFANLFDLHVMLPVRAKVRPTQPHTGSGFARAVGVVGWLALAVMGLVVAREPVSARVLLHPLLAGPQWGVNALMLLCGLVAALTFRGLLRAAYLVVSGFPPAALGLRVRLGLPFLDVPGEAARYLSATTCLPIGSRRPTTRATTRSTSPTTSAPGSSPPGVNLRFGPSAEVPVSS